MKIVKTVLKILGILLAVILLLVTIALFFANKLVKDAIESTVPDLTGVSCKVGRVAVQPFRARMCVYKLVLGNPDGYASEYSVAIDKMTFVLDPAALFNRKIVIDEIRLEDLKINYETTLTLAESNELDIIKRLDRSTAEEQHALEEAKARNSAFPRTRVPIRPRVRLNRLTVQNIRLLIIPKGFTSGIPLNVTLPEMGPMGTDGDGLTSLALLDRIANEMYTRIYDFAMESKTQIMQNLFSPADSSD